MAYILKHIDKCECLNCGTAIYGRADKKFCSLKCKNAYHNDAISNHRRVRNHAIKTLTANYEILDRLERSKIRSISLDRIKELGFDENFSTGHNIGKVNLSEENCFDITYRRTQAKIYHIRRIT